MRENRKVLRRHHQMTNAQEQAVASQVGNLLHATYPGYIWLVNAHDGVVTVHNALLSGQWGFLLKITDLDPEGRAVKNAGGELLERYRLSRACNRVVGQESMGSIKRDFRGEAIRAE